MFPRRRLFSLALVAVVAFTACSDQPPDAAATVGDAQIADADIAQVSRVLRSVGSIQQTPCGQVEPEGDTAEAACNRVSLGLLLQFQLAGAYAADNGIEVTEAELGEAVASFDTNLGAEALDEALTSFGSNRDEFMAVLGDSLLQQEVSIALAEAELGEEGLRQAYEDSLADNTIVQVDHILVETEEEAQAIYEQVTAPGSTRQEFLRLAEQESIDPSATENSGSLGSAPASQYVPEFSEAALALENGQISEPVQTEFGWHVIRMEDKEVTPYEDVREDLLVQNAGTAFADYMRAAIDDGRVEVNPRFGALDRQTLQISKVHSTDPSVSPTPAGDEQIAPPSG
jgi:parvulin-like peptidyl-prolyl isomerase